MPPLSHIIVYLVAIGTLGAMLTHDSATRRAPQPHSATLTVTDAHGDGTTIYLTPKRSQVTISLDRDGTWSHRYIEQ